MRRFRQGIPEDVPKNCLDYMGISEPRFREIIDCTSPLHLWERKKNGDWNLR